MRSVEFRERSRWLTINRGYTYKRPFGFCNVDRHKGYLTYRQFKRHKCLEKQCPFLTLNANHAMNKEKRK